MSQPFNIYKNLPHKQKGFLLPVAIFLLVVLAGLGAYAVNLTATANASSVQDILGVRAYMAARAGAEWGAMKVLAPGTTTMADCPAASTSLTINNFSVTVGCTRNEYAEQGGDQTIRVYDITSTATQGTAGNADFVSRQIKVTLSRCLQGTIECN